MSSDLINFADPFSDTSVGIVVGSLTIQGGAEEVAVTLADELNAPVYTTEYDPQRFDKEFREKVEGRVVLLQKDTGTDFKPGDEGFVLRGSPTPGSLTNNDFAKIDFDKVTTDILFPTDIEAASIAYRSGKPYVTYIHHPNKVLSDYFWEEFDRKPGLRSKLSFLGRRWRAVRHMKGVARASDMLICNSVRTRERTKKAWDMEDTPMEVLYPPVDTDFYTPGEPESLPFEFDRFYFAPQRLEPYKNIHTVVEAAKRAREHLVITGSGTMEDYIRREAQYSDYIHYLGYVNERRLRDLYRGSTATIQGTLREDFGIVPTEAMSCGTPCILPASGGFLESVGNGYTDDMPETHETPRGLLIGAEDYDVSSLAGAMQNFDPSDYDTHEISEYAQKYSTESFMESVNKILSELYNHI